VALTVERLDRVVIVVGDLDRLSRFYAALGFRPDDARPAPEQAALAEAPTAVSRVMWVGEQAVELVAFDPPGADYPLPARSTDPWFQHIALVAPDIDAAMARLRAAEGWTAISRGGVSHLPRDAGRVTAFKFRDPEGHPLEFLAFPTGQAPPRWSTAGPGLLGYDHSAISVSDIARSIAFYRDELGMTLGPRTLNQGAAQAALDDVADAMVDVVAMRPVTATPHVELLGYRHAPPHFPLAAGARNGVATRLVVAANDIASPRLMRDPDGHWLQLIPR